MVYFSCLEAGDRGLLIKQDINRIIRSAGRRQVGKSVSVKIADGYRANLATSGVGEDSRLEGAIAVALKNGDIRAIIRGHPQVQESILVDIAHHNIPRCRWSGVISWRVKCAV